MKRDKIEEEEEVAGNKRLASDPLEELGEEMRVPPDWVRCYNCIVFC